MPVLALEDQGLIQAFHSTLSYAFLSSLEESNSAVANTGWQARTSRGVRSWHRN
jgi:predicted N-acyltransferase